MRCKRCVIQDTVLAGDEIFVYKGESFCRNHYIKHKAREMREVDTRPPLVEWTGNGFRINEQDYSADEVMRYKSIISDQETPLDNEPPTT